MRRMLGRGEWLLAPFGVLFALFFVLPIGYAVYESLFTVHSSGLGFGGGSVSFVGFKNYIDVLTNTTFGGGLERVLLFSVVDIPGTIGLGLVLALLLDLPVRARGALRLLYFVPYAIPGVVGGLLWAFLYQPGLSPYSRVLLDLHLGNVDFLSNRLVFWSIANIVIWGYAGYNMLIITAALNAIPAEQFEAARIDGASRFGEIWYLKLPQIQPAIIMTVLFGIIGTLQLFNEPIVLSEVTRSVSISYTPNMYAYTSAFANDNYYYGSAVAVVLAVITLAFSFGFLRLVQRRAAL